MNLTSDDVKLELREAPGRIEVWLFSEAGQAAALLTPDQARAVADELYGMADDLDLNPGGALN